MTKKIKNGKIELLRFIFSIVVLLLHSNTFSSNEMPLLFFRGALSVEFFFLLSGYFMVVSVQRTADPPPWTLAGIPGTFCGERFVV